MTEVAIPELVKDVRDLPALPAIVAELMSSLGREDAGTGVLAEKLSQDQALTAKTLRLANSSFYGMQRKVDTIQQAVAILGFNSVRTLVTAAAVASTFPMDGPGPFDFRAFWRHAIASALCAKALARYMQANADQAFMIGLLHDIGRLVLVTRCGELYETAIAHRAEYDCFLFEAERAVLGIDHAAVGQALAHHWKFPVAMQKAIAGHHMVDPMETGSLALVAHASDAITHALDLTGVDDDLVPPVSSALPTELFSDTEVMNRLFREIEQQFEEACQILIA